MVFQVPARALKTTSDPQKSGSCHRQGQIGHPEVTEHLSCGEGKLQNTHKNTNGQMQGQDQPFCAQAAASKHWICTANLSEPQCHSYTAPAGLHHQRWGFCFVHAPQPLAKGNLVLLKAKNLVNVVSILQDSIRNPLSSVPLKAMSNHSWREELACTIPWHIIYYYY